MTKILSALAVVLCLSLFGAPVAGAFASASPGTFTQDGDGKKKGKKKRGKKKHQKGAKKGKKSGKKHGRKKGSQKK
ncbi:MAG TPA: hypothetical protein VM222_03665 [Planctomycetota bacterium]|nr:hypothetical protein [Planctomycetota bacterium]